MDYMRYCSTFSIGRLHERAQTPLPLQKLIGVRPRPQILGCDSNELPVSVLYCGAYYIEGRMIEAPWMTK